MKGSEGGEREEEREASKGEREGVELRRECAP